MFESLPNETTDLRSSHSNGVKIENGPKIAFIQNGVVPKLSSNLNFSTYVDTDEIVDDNNYYENSDKYDEYYCDEDEVKNNYDEDGNLSPNLVIKFYKVLSIHVFSQTISLQFQICLFLITNVDPDYLFSEIYFRTSQDLSTFCTLRPAKPLAKSSK